MQNHQAQYASVSHSSEEHSTQIYERNYASDLNHQVHGTVSPISRRSLEWRNEDFNNSKQHLHHRQVDEQAHGNWNNTESFETLNLKNGFNHQDFPKGRKRGVIERIGDWWWWEIGSVFLSLSCIVAIIVTLLVMQDKALSSWHSSVAPNALISILATISKASLLFAATGCISQIKWLHFKQSPHTLFDMQTFDDASRGPLGAVELLTRLSPREMFKPGSVAGWALWASILTILTLPLDPFAQQVLAFPQRSVPSQGESGATIPTAQIYDSGNMAGVTYSQSKNVEVAMQGAVMNGLYTLGSPISFACTTAHCTWPTFYTIGICSSCTNVTGQVNATCAFRAGKSCNYTLPSGLKLRASQSYSSGGGSQTTLNATARRGSNDTGNRLVDVGLVKIASYENPQALDCSLTWCAKRYSGVRVSSGKIETPEIKTWALHPPKNYWQAGNTWQNAYRIPDDVTDFDGPNRTFTVNTKDHATLRDWLAETLFQTVNQDAVARALYLSPNITETFENIAVSMTNHIREARNGTVVRGTSFREETYIRVRWAWLILPGVVVLMGVVLLVASMILSRGDEDGLWKNSVMATMFTQMRGWDGLRFGTWSEMRGQARDMRGRLERSGDGGLSFVRS